MDDRLIATLAPETRKRLVESAAKEFTSAEAAKALFSFVPFFEYAVKPATKFVANKVFGSNYQALIDSACKIMNLQNAAENYRFPINHPIDGSVYACSEQEPIFYVPVATFHQYMWKAKMSAFHQLCANLGARRCFVLYAEENGKDVTAKVTAQGIPTQGGPLSGEASVGRQTRSKSNATVAAEYGPPKKAPCRTDTAWMNDEPTWRTMEDLRLGHGLESFVAEFSFQDDLGINAKVASKLIEAGLEIGGTFEQFTKKHWKFEVEFWPIDESSK